MGWELKSLSQQVGRSKLLNGRWREQRRQWWGQCFPLSRPTLDTAKCRFQATRQVDHLYRQFLRPHLYRHYLSDYNDDQTVSEPMRTNQGNGTLHRSKTHGLSLQSLALVMGRYVEKGQLWGERRGRGLGNGLRTTTRHPERGQTRTMLFLVSLALQSQVSCRLSAIFSRRLTLSWLLVVSVCWGGGDVNWQGKLSVRPFIPDFMWGLDRWHLL